MKLFYAIAIVLVLFVSACAQQTVEQAPVTEPQTSAPAVEQPEAEAAGTGVAVVEEKVTEATSNEIRYVGAGGFDPAELTIGTGSTVTWINNDEKKGAIVIFKDNRAYMNSGGLTAGEKFEAEFTEAGEYEFWWNIALSGDSGKITVE